MQITTEKADKLEFLSKHDVQFDNFQIQKSGLQFHFQVYFHFKSENKKPVSFRTLKNYMLMEFPFKINFGLNLTGMFFYNWPCSAANVSVKCPISFLCLLFSFVFCYFIILSYRIFIYS